MKTHRTANGDNFAKVRHHIIESTPWIREAYRPPAHPLPADRVPRYLTVSAATALGILGLLGIVTFLSK